MEHIITKFNNKTGDVEVITPIPFTVDDGEFIANIPSEPKYEKIDDYNIFDLIRENATLKQEKENYKQAIEKIRKEINDEYSIMGVKVVENDTLDDILKEVE